MNFVVGGTTMGLAFGSKTVELLAMQGKKVVASRRVLLEGNDPGQVARAIQLAMAQSGMQPKRCAVSVPGHEALIRFFTMPVVPKSEWEGAVQFEARKYIPFKIDSLVWDYQVVPSLEANKLDVIFAAISREMFQQVQEVCAVVGVHPTVVEPRSLSLARLVDDERGGAANEFIGVVDVEPSMAHLAMVRHGMPYLTRSFSLLRSLETPLGLASGGEGGSSEAAGAGDVRLGAGPPDPGRPSGSRDERLQRLASELSVSRDFFTREYPGTVIRRVLLFGDETLAGEWAHEVAAQVGCPVELGSAALSRSVTGSIPLEFAAAVGLLHGGPGRKGGTLDFLRRSRPKTEAGPRAGVAVPRMKIAPEGRLVKICLGLGMCCVVFFWVAGQLAVSSARRELVEAKASAPDVGWGLRGMTQADLKTLQDAANAQLAMLKATVDQRLSVARRLDALVRMLPDGVWLTGLTFEDRWESGGRGQPRLLINGACFLGTAEAELSAIQKFQDKVKNHQTFLEGFMDTVRLEQINAQTALPQQQTYRTFQLSCGGGGWRS